MPSEGIRKHQRNTLYIANCVGIYDSYYSHINIYIYMHFCHLASTSSFNSLRSNNCNLPLHVQVHLHIKIVSSNGRFLLHKKNFMDESLGISYDVIIHYYIELVLWGVWSGEVA